MLRDSPSRLRARICAQAVFVACLATLPSCGNNQPRDDWSVTATEIVASSTRTRAEVLLDAADRPHVRAFLDREDVENAQTRAVLIEAWAGSPELKAKAEMLPENAFEDAEQDGGWPEGRTIAESAYVEGFRTGLAKFLEGG